MKRTVFFYYFSHNKMYNNGIVKYKSSSNLTLAQKKILQNPRFILWSINYQIWAKENLEQMFASIEQWQIESFSMKVIMKNIKIFERISHIRFPLMKCLCLDILIQSIECLVRIEMPVLEKIIFCRNNLVWIKTMKKSYWPKLHSIFLKMNPILDAPLTVPSILWKDNFFFSLSIYRNYEMRWISKIEPNKQAKINLQLDENKVQVHEKNAEKILLKKFKSESEIKYETNKYPS